MATRYAATEIGHFTDPARVRDYQQALRIRESVERLADDMFARDNQGPLPDGKSRDWNDAVDTVTLTELDLPKDRFPSVHMTPTLSGMAQRESGQLRTVNATAVYYTIGNAMTPQQVSVKADTTPTGIRYELGPGWALFNHDGSVETDASGPVPLSATPIRTASPPSAPAVSPSTPPSSTTKRNAFDIEALSAADKRKLAADLVRQADAQDAKRPQIEVADSQVVVNGVRLPVNPTRR